MRISQFDHLCLFDPNCIWRVFKMSQNYILSFHEQARTRKNERINLKIVIGKILHEMKIIIFQSIIIHLFYHLNILYNENCQYYNDNTHLSPYPSHSLETFNKNQYFIPLSNNGDVRLGRYFNKHFLCGIHSTPDVDRAIT